MSFKYDLDPGPGPFTVVMVPEGSRYELSRGHAIYCAPAGGSHGAANTAAALVLGADPGVEEIGTDVGYTARKDQLRAPDLSVGNVPAKPGWVNGAPRLAVEIADVGQDERDLAAKIQDLLEAGTEQVWVVRLVGPRRVEVWRQDRSATLYTPGQVITAEGILRRPVPVEALFELDAARDAALSGLLARFGYKDLDAVRLAGVAEGRQEGQQEGSLRSLRQALRAVLSSRQVALAAPQDAAIDGCVDLSQLQRWIAAAALAERAEQVFG